MNRNVSFRDGSPVCVMRPDDARPSINAALRALHTNNAGEMQAAATGAFTFVGWLSTDGCVIDQHGEICGELQPGDHMVTWDTPEEMAAAFGLKTMKKTQQQAAELLAELERSARDARQHRPLVKVCIRAAAGERVPARDWSFAVATSVCVEVATRAVRALQKPRARARARRRRR